MRCHARSFIANALFLYTALGFGAAFAAEMPYYSGKTITVVIGTSPGGTGGMRYTMVMKYLRMHLPGNPTLVARYMPGAGGTSAANYIAHTAKRDGLTLSGISSSLYSKAILGSRGARYTLDDFVFLGAPYSGGPHVLIARPGLHADTVEKLKAHKRLRFAARSVGHALYVVDRLFAYVLELDNPQWVLGYNQQEMNLALERQEADLLCTTLHSAVRDKMPWFKKGYASPAILRNAKGRSVEAAPEFPKNPARLDDYADTPMKREILEFHKAMRPSSSVLLAPRGIPEPALVALRTAFQKVWNDAQFTEEYTRTIREPMDPVDGKQIEALLSMAPKDPKIRKAYKQIVGAGPLPQAR